MCTFCQFPRTRISTSTSRQIRRTSAFTVLHSDTRWAGRGRGRLPKCRGGGWPLCAGEPLLPPQLQVRQHVAPALGPRQDRGHHQGRGAGPGAAGDTISTISIIFILKSSLYIYNIYRWTMVTTCCGVRSGTATSGRRRWGVTIPASSTGTTEQQADHWAVSRIRYVHMYIFSYIIHYQLFSSLME